MISFNTRVTAVGSLGGVVMGYDAGAISGALLFLHKAFGVTTVQKEYIVTSVLVGAMVGSLLASRLANTMGRKKTLLICGVLSSVFSLFTALSMNVAELEMSRLLTGVVIGVIAVTAPMYISELALARNRGRSSSTYQLGVALGLTASYWGDYLFSGTGDWRAMFAVCVVPSLFMVFGLLIVPESPRWLYMRRADEQANRVLFDMYKNSEEVKEVENSIIAERERTGTDQRGTLRDLLQPGLRWALLFGVLLSIFEQLGGIKAVTYYSPTVFRLAGFTRSNAILVTAVIGIITIVATVIGIQLVDRWGRKPLLFVSLTGMGLSMGALGLSFWVPREIGFLGPLTFFCVMLYHISFSFGFGLMGWVYIPEIFPTRMRAKGQSISRLFNWIAGFTVSLTFLSIVGHIGPAGVFWIFTGIIALALLFVAFFAPETKERSLEQIYLYWMSGRTWPSEGRK